MNEWTDTLRAHSRHALAQVAGRLARALQAQLPPRADAPADLAAAIATAQALSLAAQPSSSMPSMKAGQDVARLALQAQAPLHPLRRVHGLIEAHVHATVHAQAQALAQAQPQSQAPSQGQWPDPSGAPSLTPAQHADLACDLLLLACLPEWHEGLATLCRLTHPQAWSWPTVTLALSWLEAENPELREPLRDAVEDLLLRSPLAHLGLIQLHGDGPWHGRTLMPGAGLWSALMARTPTEPGHPLVAGFEQVPGLAHWLLQPEVQQAIKALQQGLPCQLLLVGGDAAMRQTRVRALLGAAQASAVRQPAHEVQGAAAQAVAAWKPALSLAWLYQSCIWLEDRHDDAPDGRREAMAAPDPAALTHTAWQIPVIASATQASHLPDLGLPQIRLPIQPLPAVARRQLWQHLLPQLGAQANVLAARYPIEPDDARDVVRDLALRQQLAEAPLHLDDIGACVRARTAAVQRAGLSRVLPQAHWDELLLPTQAVDQLQSAVRRVLQQLTVLDDWGFAQGRQDRRGVRMLFYGRPGTGKTLAAEVMARALGVDLLVVDLASLVSKWIGETEKNLAAVFDVAERSRALLLFDEADALFGKRTETHDAQDRYANLETAYLLQRLERYEGVAVLTTNLRSQMDNAFSRRFEFIVEFPEPDAAVRTALWRLHLPAQAPLAGDVNLPELADWYPLSGAQIKNAALAAAFLAASAGQPIAQRHFLWAIEREFDKAGKAHPGYPAEHLAALSAMSSLSSSNGLDPITGGSS
ncbi:MAG: ATP-binding protein [Aquabacterium sp.]